MPTNTISPSSNTKIRVGRSNGAKPRRCPSFRRHSTLAPYSFSLNNRAVVDKSQRSPDINNGLFPNPELDSGLHTSSFAVKKIDRELEDRQTLRRNSLGTPSRWGGSERTFQNPLSRSDSNLDGRFLPLPSKPQCDATELENEESEESTYADPVWSPSPRQRFYFFKPHSLTHARDARDSSWHPGNERAVIDKTQQRMQQSETSCCIDADLLSQQQCAAAKTEEVDEVSSFAELDNSPLPPQRFRLFRMRSLTASIRQNSETSCSNRDKEILLPRHQCGGTNLDDGIHLSSFTESHAPLAARLNGRGSLGSPAVFRKSESSCSIDCGCTDKNYLLSTKDAPANGREQPNGVSPSENIDNPKGLFLLSPRHNRNKRLLYHRHQRSSSLDEKCLLLPRTAEDLPVPHDYIRSLRRNSLGGTSADWELHHDLQEMQVSKKSLFDSSHDRGHAMLANKVNDDVVSFTDQQDMGYIVSVEKPLSSSLSTFPTVTDDSSSLNSWSTSETSSPVSQTRRCNWNMSQRVVSRRNSVSSPNCRTSFQTRKPNSLRLSLVECLSPRQRDYSALLAQENDAMTAFVSQDGEETKGNFVSYQHSFDDENDSDSGSSASCEDHSSVTWDASHGAHSAELMINTDDPTYGTIWIRSPGSHQAHLELNICSGTREAATAARRKLNAAIWKQFHLRQTAL